MTSHSFAVRTPALVSDGADGGALHAHPLAYLGHAHVNDTFWYLSATPELFHAVTQYASNTDRKESHDAN